MARAIFFPLHLMSNIQIKIKNKRVASPLSPELFGDNTTKQDGELEINNDIFGAVLTSSVNLVNQTNL
jgi:hypothetical protein